MIFLLVELHLELNVNPRIALDIGNASNAIEFVNIYRYDPGVAWYDIIIAHIVNQLRILLCVLMIIVEFYEAKSK